MYNPVSRLSCTLITIGAKRTRAYFTMNFSHKTFACICSVSPSHEDRACKYVYVCVRERERKRENVASPDEVNKDLNSGQGATTDLGYCITRRRIYERGFAISWNETQGETERSPAPRRETSRENAAEYETDVCTPPDLDRLVTVIVARAHPDLAWKVIVAFLVFCLLLSTFARAPCLSSDLARMRARATNQATRVSPKTRCPNTYASSGTTIVQFVVIARGSKQHPR